MFTFGLRTKLIQRVCGTDKSLGYLLLNLGSFVALLAPKLSQVCHVKRLSG